MPTQEARAFPRRPILLCAVGGGMFGSSVPRALAAQTSLLETGSTLLYPLFNLWVAKYRFTDPTLRITTQGTGSGTGIAQTISGVAQIGASDAYMSGPQVRRNPEILNIPLAISAQTVNYNVPGLNAAALNLSGPLLAAVYSGRITHWNDPAIAAANRHLMLPAEVITPIHRTDGSGDTFIFSQYLAFSTPEWNQRVGYGATLSWPPVIGGIGALGNPGMVQATRGTSGSLAYIGISFDAEIAKAGLGTARLRNRPGNFVAATKATMGAAVAAFEARTPPDGRISLVFAPGANAYPIINYEYAIVSRKQPNRKTAAAVRDFLSWAIDPNGGSATTLLDVVRFLPLPPEVALLARRQIAKIGP